MNEAMQDRDANQGNRKVAVRALALEIIRNDSFLTMVEAVERASELYQKGIRV